MNVKKLFVGFFAIALVVVSAAMFAAFEAHVINVTARIENALTVGTEPIDFGTVFPQESLDRSVGVELSTSFVNDGNTGSNTVDYVIRQKPKCYNGTTKEYGLVTEDGNGKFVCADGQGYEILPVLCPFLSKHEKTGDGTYSGGENDSEGINAFHGPVTGWALQDTIDTQVKGELSKFYGDVDDEWNIDFRVPCFNGSCAQDWAKFVHDNNPNADPDKYKLDPNDEHKLFGCDLWVEVTGISKIK